jgi:hypothetical protein
VEDVPLIRHGHGRPWRDCVATNVACCVEDRAADAAGIGVTALRDQRHVMGARGE